MENTHRWRVVEVPFLGALAQTCAMCTAIFSFWLCGADWATLALGALAVAMYATKHLPTMMSALAGIPVVWLSEAITNRWSQSMITFFILELLILDYGAAMITHRVEPVIRIGPRFAWQFLVSTTVLATCLITTGYAGEFEGVVTLVGFVTIWSWALIVQPRGTNIFG